MSTTLADLLDAIDHRLSTRDGAADTADADRAVAVLGRALQRLADDGLARSLGTDRERWMREAARASLQSAGPATARDIGWLSMVAAAAVDTITLMRADLGNQQRWAIATAVTDTLGPLTVVALHGNITADRRRALVGADAAAMVVQRLAALDPPLAVDCAALDWAVPNPAPVPRAAAATVITEATAGLEYSTRSQPGTLSLADYLAVGISVEALSRAAGSLPDANRATINAAATASRGWAAARAVLNPFDDGSRRPHTDAPPVVGHALVLYDALSTALRQLSQPGHPSAPVRAAVTAALQRVPVIADHLQLTLTQWAHSGALLGFARDLTLREDHVSAHLHGYDSRGLVRADIPDLAPARTTLLTAKILSIELAAHTAPADPTGSGVPNLAAANLSARAQLTADHIGWAATHTQTTLRDHAGPPRATAVPGPRR